MREIFPEKKSQPVVGEHPREDGVLREVVVRPPRELIQLHQKLKVGDFACAPFFHHARTLEPLVARQSRGHKLDAVQLQALAGAAQNPIGLVARLAVD